MRIFSRAERFCLHVIVQEPHRLPIRGATHRHKAACDSERKKIMDGELTAPKAHEHKMSPNLTCVQNMPLIHPPV